MKREDFEIPEQMEDEVPSSEVRPPKKKLSPGEKLALVKLDGTAITTEGRVVAHNWFKGMGLDANKYVDVLLTAEEARRLHGAQSRTKIGAASNTPLICAGAELCPIAASCELVRIQKEIDERNEDRNVIPIGKPCPIETDILYHSIMRYAEEFSVGDDPAEYTDQQIILELAECDVLESRMNAVLSDKYQDLSEDKLTAITFSPEGERHQHIKDVADAFKVKEKLWGRRERLRKSLIATRLDKHKKETALSSGSNALDQSVVQSELAFRLRKLEGMLNREK